MSQTFAGVDGCRGGWTLALWQPSLACLRIVACVDLAEMLRQRPPPTGAVIDMPLVLEAVARPGGRACDRLARTLLPAGKKSSIFSAPSLPALAAWRQTKHYADVLAAQRATAADAPGLSIQAFNLLGHIDGLHAFVHGHPRFACVEGHPELAFQARLGRGLPPLASKHTAAGKEQRQAILERLGMPWAEAWAQRTQVKNKAAKNTRDEATARVAKTTRDDALDACVLALVAQARALGTAQVTPPVRLLGAPPMRPIRTPPTSPSGPLACIYY